MPANFVESIRVKQLLKRVRKIPLFLLSIVLLTVTILSGVITITVSSLLFLVLNARRNKAQEFSGHTFDAEYHIVE